MVSLSRSLLVGFGWAAALTAAAGEAWTNRLEIAPRAAIAGATCAWTGQGLRLQLVHAGTAITVNVAPGRTEIAPDLLQALPTTLTERVVTFPCQTPATNLVWVTFKRQPRAWWLYVSDCPVLRLPELGTNSVVLRHLLDAMPPVTAQDDYLQRTGSFRVDDSFMVPEGTQLADTWERRAGDWSLHTVTGTTVGATSNRSQLKKQPTPQRSPNFYSLDGRGAPAVILTGETFHDRYSVRVAVQHNGGTNGILFLVTERDLCHGFTARTDPVTERLILELWRGRPSSLSTREILGAVQTELLPGQWLSLEVRVFDDRVVCLADNIEVLRLRLPLPPAGRYGLLADATEGTRFDDFSAASHDEYPFDCADDVRLSTLAEQGVFLARTRFRPAGAPAELPDPCTFEAPGGGAPRERRLGSAADAPHLLSAVFMPVGQGGSYTCGLLAGWRSPADPGYRFTCRVAAGVRHLALERLTPTNTVVLGALRLPVTGNDRRVRLTLDALRPNELRALVDDRLVLLQRPAEPVTGAGGIYIAGPTAVRHALPEYTTRMSLFCDRFEKNLQYVNDPYMRHWASPEGQWLPQRDGTTWLRGDILGRVRVRLPAVDPSTLHLALDETGSNGACRVEIRNGQISAFLSSTGTQQVWRVPVADIPEQTIEGQAAARLLTVGLEDHVLWLGDDTRLLAHASLPRLARGRRVRLDGFDVPRLRQSLVRRENVFDTLFNESLYNWTINGGTWEVINRFQCEPTWSHMNGQNDRSLAALWSRYDFSGDFCVDFYAGMRMGWYERAGDLNMTVMSRRGTTGDGYSVTATGWDPDHSQLYTRLWRDGQVMAVSSNYMVPRIRAGNARTAGYEPFLSGGRDMHGAWYGMRFRRVGDRLTYLFDNEPVLDWRDPAPLQDGALGIWTYRNSMMVARVRIAAESITPHRFAFTRLDPAVAGRDVARAAAERTGPRLQAGGLPVQPLDATLWDADDPVSQPLVRMVVGSEGRRELRATAQQGGGTFMVRTVLPPVPPGRLLGWRFDLARDPETRVNFEFTTGKTAANGFEAAQLWSFVLSGSDETRGVRRVAGSAACAPTPRGAARTLWTPVEVWLPSDVLSGELSVRVDGFGNLQPSDVQQGLCGNPPGAWFAVHDFRPIHRGRPELSSDGPREALDALAAEIAGRPNGKLQRLRVPAVLDATEPELEWAVPPDASYGLAARLDPALGDALRVGSTALWHSPLLPPRKASLDDQPAPFLQDGGDTVVLLPRPLPDVPAMTLSLDLADGRTYRQSVTLRTTEGSNQPPVLVSVEMPEGGLMTFEGRSPDPTVVEGAPTASLGYGDPEQGTFLQVQNRGELQRLNLRLLPGFDPIVTPLLQFRYRGDPMAHVSLTQSRLNLAFSEGVGVSTSLSGGATLDHAWHTWLGVPIQAAGEFPVRQGFAFGVGELRVGSRNGRDQTGRYSALAFDDIACGPAAGPSRPLALRPNFSDADGVADVRYALVAGTAPWVARDDRVRLDVRWQAAVNREVVTPDTSALAEGVHHVVLQARDRRGAWSAVADIPFLLDRTPPTVTQGVRETSRYNGTCLDVALEGGVALPVLRNLKVTCNGTPVDLNGDYGQAALTASGLRLELDWPRLLRRELRTVQDGHNLSLAFDGITDLAGNPVPRFEAPIKVDFASDRCPPALLPLHACANILAWQPVCRAANDFFSQLQVQNSTLKSSNGVAFVDFHPADGAAGSWLARNFQEQPWDSEKHPWLALSVKVSGQSGTDPRLALRFQLRNPPDEAKRQKKEKDSPYVLYLPATPGANPFVQGRTDWRADEWQDILVDVRGYLRAETGLAQAPAIRTLALVFPEGGKQNLQLRAAAVLAPWGADDVLKFRAYDMSGLRGLVWQGGGALTGLGIRPSRLKVPAEDALWLKVRIADRPGNLSDFFFIPIPPGSVVNALPAEVPVED